MHTAPLLRHRRIPLLTAALFAAAFTRLLGQTVTPSTASELQRQVPLLALYQLVVVNYGDFASADDALTFGATALGLTDDEYYARLCEVIDPLCGCGIE